MDKARCSRPVTTVLCLRTELRSKNKTMSVFLAVQYFTLGGSKKRLLIIERALVLSKIVVIIPLRTLAQKRRSHVKARISEESLKDLQKS